METETRFYPTEFYTPEKYGILSKTISEDEQGRLIKNSDNCSLNMGFCRIKSFSGLEAFTEYLSKGSTQRALAHGIFLHSKEDADAFQKMPFPLTTQAAKKNGKGGIERTKENLYYLPDAPSLGMLDYDHEPGQPYFTPEQLIEVITSIFPLFAESAVVIFYSVSSFIYKGDTQLTGDNPGYHIYFLAKNGNDLKRFANVIHQRLWLMGYGYIKVSAAGSLLERSLIDLAVFSPERLDFIAKPVLGPGLEQRRPDPEYIEGNVLDTSLLPDLTEGELAEYQQKVRDAKEKIKPSAQKVEEDYVEKQSAILIERETGKGKAMSTFQARNVIRDRKNGRLSSQDVLVFDEFGEVRVADVLSDLPKYDGATLRDPMEPETGANKAKFFANTDSNGPPRLHSFLHGGINYVLTDKKDLTQVRTELDAIIKSYEGTAGLAEECCNAIYDANLNKADREKALQHLVVEKVGTKRQLNKIFKNIVIQRQGAQKMQEIENNAGGRTAILHEPGNLNKNVKEVDIGLSEDPTGTSYFQFGGALCFVSSKNIPGNGETPVIQLHTPATIALLVDSKFYFYKTSDKTGEPKPEKVPIEVIKALLEYPDTRAPQINGLVSHPVITPDGEVEDKEGINPLSNLLIMHNNKAFKAVPENPTKEQAQEAIKYLRDHFFSEICFAKTTTDAPEGFGLYELLALALLLTGVIRKVIGIAPGFVITANVQGTGKTTLARIIHLLVTGNEMSVHSLSGSSEEFEKQILALLKAAIEMICFDNQFDGCELKNPTLSRIITSPIFTGRILGVTQEMTVPTHALFIVTGNNITVSSDLLRRFFCVILHTEDERPENRTYKVQDIAEHCLKYRAEALQACLTIIKAYIANGSAYKGTETKMSGFPEWDHMVRFPILWATGVDILEAMELSRNESEEQMAMAGIFSGIFEIYGTGVFIATELFHRLEPAAYMYSNSSLSWKEEDLASSILHFAKNALTSPKTFAWVLKRLKGRTINNRKLNYTSNSSGNRGKYWIEMVDPVEKAAYEAEQAEMSESIDTRESYTSDFNMDW